MRRSVGVLLALACADCGKSAALIERPRVPFPAPTNAAKLPELSSLALIARPARPSEPVRILAPAAEVELDPTTANSLTVEVAGPSGPGAALVLSLDGARPRPVAPGTFAITKLLDPGGSLLSGTHDLVLAAVNADGVALEPGAGGVASLRFFVGPRSDVPRARVVCLSPFGTYYGKAPNVLLDFVVVGAAAANAVVTLESAGVSRRVRASGAGPFALGDIAAGDHELSIALADGAPAVPGRCGFAYNPEIERAK